VSGSGGLVYCADTTEVRRIAWSLVNPFLPFTRLMLACLDDIEDRYLQVLDSLAAWT
jgi:hypothetical protein